MQTYVMLPVMLPVIYSGANHIEMSKRIYIYIFTNHVCLLSIEKFEICYKYYVYKSNIVIMT